MKKISAGTVGELVAVLPLHLGFVPQESILLAELGGDGRLGALARVDLDFTVGQRALTAQTLAHLAHVAEVFGERGTDEVLVVAITERVERADAGRVAELFTAALGDSLDVYGAPIVASGTQTCQWWVCTCCGDTGVVPDLADVTGAQEAMDAHGAPLASRAELTAMLEQDDETVAPEKIAAVRAQIDREPLAKALRTLVAMVEAAQSETTSEQAAFVGAALLDLAVRDAFLGFGVSIHLRQARDLACRAARRLTGEPRAAAATAAAVMFYIEGNGPMTGVALDAALDADRGYRAAHLTARALTAGMAPAEMRPASQLGVEVARRIGVELPGVLAEMDEREEVDRA